MDIYEVRQHLDQIKAHVRDLGSQIERLETALQTEQSQRTGGFTPAEQELIDRGDGMFVRGWLWRIQAGDMTGCPIR